MVWPSGAIITDLMGNEGDVIRYTVASGTRIIKGRVLEMTDPRTAIAVTATTAGTVIAPNAGISAAEKSIADGDVSTTLGVVTNCIAKLGCSGAVILGASVVSVEDNMVKTATPFTTGASGAYILGYAMETGADKESIAVRVRL